MIRRLLAAIIVTLVLAGCELVAEGETEILSGDAKHVVIRAGDRGDPAEVAGNYCGSYGKSAVLDHSEPVVNRAHFATYYYVCR
ncbi:MAG TPA: hypothetical protein VKY65_16660 [Alphaproteobacteria bacterium]|nr:hypothetical protein [Alphaproteobacteria bacterium]